MGRFETLVQCECSYILLSGCLKLRRNNKISTPDVPSKTPEIKDINESTVDMAATPPTT